MTREEAIAQLKMDRDLANFNPMTGEEEPMNEDCRKSVEALDMAIKALKQMNSSENQGNWIPVSERMPEPRIDVWCNSDMGQMVGYYDEYAETWYGRDYLELIVTAWMPLPEPYRGGI